MNDHEHMACAVCGRPLEHIEDDRVGLDEWVHFQPGDLDHVVIPVPSHELLEVHRCDFCNVDQVVTYVLAEQFTMPPIPGSDMDNISTGNWAACSTCIVLVRRRRWTELATRVRLLLPPDMRASQRLLTDSYKRLEIHITGFQDVL